MKPMYSLKAANPERRANGDGLNRAFSLRQLPVYAVISGESLCLSGR